MFGPKRINKKNKLESGIKFKLIFELKQKIENNERII